MPSPSPCVLSGGAFQDSEGNVLALGYLTFRLNQDASVGGLNVCAGIEIRIGLDASGNIVGGSSIWGNDVLSPQNTYYRVTGYTAKGQPAWGPNNQQVAGSSFNVGSWIPNVVISWEPPVQSVLLEVNDVPNVTQSILNLEAGTNITLTDEGDGGVTIDAAGSSPISDIGGGFFGPGVFDLQAAIGNGTFSSISVGISGGVIAANVVTVYRFVLPFAITISKATWMNFGSNGGITLTAGIYDSNKNLVIDGGQWVGFPAQTLATHAFTPVTLPAGVYWHAQGTTSASAPTAPGLLFNPSGNNSNVINMWVHSSIKAATAANPLVAGALPATLGALTGFTPTNPNGDGIACPFYET